MNTSTTLSMNEQALPELREPETPEVLRARAARIRAAARELEVDAQYIDGPAYYNTQRSIQDRYAQAAALDKLAQEREAEGYEPSLEGITARAENATAQLRMGSGGTLDEKSSVCTDTTQGAPVSDSKAAASAASN